MNIVTDLILPLALAFIMFALGLGLTTSDFIRVIKQPKDFFVGAISQIIDITCSNIPSSHKTEIIMAGLFFFINILEHQTSLAPI